MEKPVRKPRSPGGLVTNPRHTRLCDRNAAIARIAESQGGHVTRRQLLDAGVGPDAIEWRARLGELIRVHHGVYAVGHLPTNPVDQASGALLAAGPRAAVAGRSAGAHWGLFATWQPKIEVISPLRLRIPGVAARQSRTLLARDVATHEGLRVTSPARTLLDIAPLLRPRDLSDFHNRLRIRNLIENEDLVDVAERNRTHPGAARLRALSKENPGRPSRSIFEIDWVPFAQRHNLPPHELNVDVAGKEVDVLFTPARLIVELDGWATHGTREAYESDRDRDSHILAATGIPTIRITKRAFRASPRKQAQRILTILEQRPPTPAEKPPKRRRTATIDASSD